MSHDKGVCLAALRHFLVIYHFMLQGFFCVMINSAVHVLVYSYYGLAALGPHMQKYLWWKRYLTIIQVVRSNVLFLSLFQINIYSNTNIVIIYEICTPLQIQFVAFTIHASVGILSGCDHPLVTSWITLSNSIIQLSMFCNFYARSYLKSKTKIS